MKKNKLLKLTGIILCLVMLCGVMAMTASAEENTLITTVQVYGIDAPVPGENPDYSYTVESQAYDVLYGTQGVFWYDENGSEVSGTFVKDKKYTLRVYFTAKAGYEFPEKASELSAYLGSGNIKVSVGSDGEGFYLEHTYEPCGQINTIVIAATKPEAGAKPAFTAVWDGRYYSANTNPSYEKNGVKWYDESAKRYLISGTTTCYFEAHHTYTVSYSIKAVDGCDFNGQTTATVNGQEAELLCDNASGATVRYTFTPLCAPEFVESNFPSCDKTGNIGYYVCSCGNWYWDASATEPITDKEEVVIPPTGAHKLSVVGAKAATCTVKGYTGDEVCSVCEKTIEKGEEIALKAHTPVKDAAVAATYKAEGKTEGSHCKVCNYVIKKQEAVARKALPKVTGLKTKSVSLASGSKSKLTLTWTKIAGAEKYEIQQYVSKKWKTIKTTSKTSYTVTGLKANKSYKFRVRAVAGKYYGSFSSSYTGKTVPLTTSLALKAGKKQLAASWKTVSNITGYEVTYSTSKKFTKKTTKTVTIKKSKTKKTTIKKLTKGKKYYVKVRAYKTVSGKKIYGAWSAVKNVKVK